MVFTVIPYFPISKDNVFEKDVKPALVTFERTIFSAGSFAVVEVKFIILPHFFFLHIILVL